MSAPPVPPPPGPPAPPPGRGQRLGSWAFALAVVVVVAAAVVMIVWLTRDKGPTAANASTSTGVVPSASTVVPSPTETASSPLPGTTSTSPAATSTSTSTSTSSTSSTTSSTTTTLSPGACTGPGAGLIPADLTVVTEVMGDFDGSGAADDRFMLMTGATGGTWPRVELSYGYSATRPTFTPKAWAGDARAVNLGGPADLAVVQIVFGHGRGAYLWSFHDCELHLLSEPDTFTMGFALVDMPREKRGIRCLEDRISVVQATTEDGITWWAGGYALLWDPVTATLRKPPWFGPGPEPLTALVPLHSPEDDTLIQSYANFDC